MSSLIFHLDEDQALVATDTLATSYDYTPSMFTSKSFILPHLRMILCGIGEGGFCAQWLIKVNDGRIIYNNNGPLVTDIKSLDQHTPNNLQLLWTDFKQLFSIADTATVAIYHFGLSEEDNLIYAYSYNSRSNFESKQLPYSIGVKPECTIPSPYVFPEDIKKMMREQRQIQAKKTKQERIYIGGEIQIHHLTKSGISVYTLDRFEDYEADKSIIYENYKKQ